VTGADATGSRAIGESAATGDAVRVIEDNPERIARPAEEKGVKVLLVLGEATEDAVPRQASIERASGLATTPRKDTDNVFVATTARALNPGPSMVAKAAGTAPGPSSSSPARIPPCLRLLAVTSPYVVKFHRPTGRLFDRVWFQSG